MSSGDSSKHVVSSRPTARTIAPELHADAPALPTLPAEPQTVAPELQIWLVMGLFLFLSVASLLQPFVSGEGREWMVYVVGTLLAPFVALAAPILAGKKTTVSSGRSGRLLGHFLLSLPGASSVPETAYRGYLKLLALAGPVVSERRSTLRVGRSGRLIGYFFLALLGAFVVCGAVYRAYLRIFWATGHSSTGLEFAVPMALVLMFPVWYLACQLVPDLSTGSADHPNGAAIRRQRLFACLSIIAFGLLSRHMPLWFNWRINVALGLIAGLSWFTWRAWFAPASPSSDRTKKRIDNALYVAFALGTLIPLYPPGDNFFHHWSFYLGPISVVQAGGLPLWDVPSQYGFLSILAPALLPFREAASGMHLIMSAMLVTQGLLLYRLIRDLRPGGVFRIWAGLAVLMTVYFFSGDRGGLSGPWQFPSTGAYRTFWVFMLAYVMTDLPLAGRPSRSLTAQCVWTSVLLVAGCLWSSESAIYCLGVLGVTGIAEGAVLTFRGLWRQEGRSWLLRYVIPIVALAQAVLGISVLYRMRFGFFPDWFAFLEFAVTYATAFGRLPVEPEGGVLVLGLCLGASVCYAISQIVQAKDASAARLIAPYGAMIGTLSYFVQRSHDANAANIMGGVWFPLLLVLYVSAKERRDQAWTTTLQSVILPAFVVMSTMVCCLDSSGLARLKDFFTTLPASSIESAIASRYDTNYALLPSVRAKVGDLPLTNISSYYPYNSLPSLPNRPFLPIAPREMFILLPSERQKLILERYIKQLHTPEGIIFRREPLVAWDNPDWRDGHYEMLRNLYEVLPLHYELVEKISLDDKWHEGYWLERWRKR